MSNAHTNPGETMATTLTNEFSSWNTNSIGLELALLRRQHRESRNGLDPHRLRRLFAAKIELADRAGHVSGLKSDLGAIVRHLVPARGTERMEWERTAQLAEAVLWRRGILGR